MGNAILKRQKKILGIVILMLIFTFIMFFLFFTPVSPIGADLRAKSTGLKTAAEGFWGAIGFYKDPVDNNTTYFLMLTFFLLAIIKTIKTSFFPDRKYKNKTGWLSGLLNTKTIGQKSNRSWK